ncbi:MAG: thioredoxin domain-containing protein [bacterium]|nr:thioredoxin domain-containing protein [bacterium]
MSEQKRSFFDGDPRMLFVFGLVTGVALTMIFSGGFSTPSFASNNGGNRVAANDTAAGAAAGAGAGQPVGELAVANGDDHVRGNLNKAKVVLVEYSDFECPFCNRHHPTMQQIMEDYGDDVAWVWRHFPLSFHPNAQKAAEASECAADQGKFWEMADALTENYDQLNAALYSQLAEEVGLNVNRFQTCLDSGEKAEEVRADMQTGATAGVSGTPATFVNGQLVSGAVPYTSFQQIIDAELGN